MEEDVRWEQRFSNYNKALDKLLESVELIQKKLKIEGLASSDLETIDEIIKEGIIQRFEYTHELAWNVMKDYAKYQGNSTIGGSRDATREAFKLQLIEDGHLWMDMVSSRNQSSHTYNESTANEIFHKIIYQYKDAFQVFQMKMESVRSGNQTDLF